MLNKVKFRHLEVFVAVARFASLKRAAEQLLLTQPAVTKTLKDLEDIVGHRLADRGRAGVRLTAEGELFLQYAEQSTSAVQHGLRSLQGSTPAGGRIRVGALPSVSSSILPSVAHTFAMRNPDTLVEIEEGSLLDLIARLRSGGLDLVVGRLGRPESLAGVSFQQLYNEEVVVVSRPDSKVAHARSFDELEGCRIVYPPKDSAIRPLVARMLIAKGVPLYANRIESTSPSFGRALTLLDPNVVWFISRGVVEADLASGQFVRISVDTSTTGGAVGIMLRADDVPSPSIRAFSRQVRTYIKESRAGLS